MEGLYGYVIDLSQLGLGEHQFSYHLNDEFFASLEDAEVQKGSVEASVEIIAHEEFFEIHYQVTGTIQIPCDRCLDDMQLDVDASDNVLVKFGDERQEEDGIIYITESDSELDLAWLLYEQIALSIPIMHVHEDGECNPEMMAQLEAHNGETQTTTDPRWDALKGLLE